MRAVIQRVGQASVSIDGEVVGKIARGLLVLLGVEQGDGDQDLMYVANKTIGLRVFPDDEGKMNRSVLECGGQVLVISQFTLLGDVRRGKPPSFITAAPPEQADRFYQRFCQRLSNDGIPVECGVFQADMQVALINDGPVTILLDSRKLF